MGMGRPARRDLLPGKHARADQHRPQMVSAPIATRRAPGLLGAGLLGAGLLTMTLLTMTLLAVTALPGVAAPLDAEVVAEPISATAADTAVPQTRLSEPHAHLGGLEGPFAPTEHDGPAPPALPPVPTPVPEPLPVAPWDRTSAEVRAERRFFDAHNRARRDPGAYGYGYYPTQPALRWADDVAEVARYWSDQMAHTGRFFHNPDYGRQVCCHLGAGENIVMGGPGYLTHFGQDGAVDRLMQAWMDSPGHRINLMREQWLEVGIGVTIVSDGAIYATAVFRAPTAAAPPSSTRYQPPARIEPASTCTGRTYALVGDWNGSGSDGIGWWCDGHTRLRDDDGTVHTFRYGRRGDVPLVADWNGNGHDTVSVIRDGTWHVNNALGGGASERTFTYGRVTRGDVPIAGAWRAGGVDLPGIVRDREWHLRFDQSGGPSDRTFVFGRLTAGDLPLWGDFNGDGRDTVGIVRGGTWHFRNTHRGGGADLSYVYGRVGTGDRPVVGNWNGDGIDTPGIVRADRWYLKDTHGGGDADRVIRFVRP